MKLQIIALSTLLLTFGCSSPNLIPDGSRYMRTQVKAHGQIAKKHYEQAAETLAKTPSADDMLYTLDRGMAEHRAGLYNKSEQTFGLAYPKLKLSAEAEVSGDIYQSGLSLLGSIVDQLTQSNLVGTGTYRYAYGLQLRGQTAKYHLSTAELTRVAAFQLLNALNSDNANTGRLAMLNLSDIQAFNVAYLDEYPFLDQSFNELLMLIYFGVTNDTAGNSAVAYNRAVDEVNRAINSFVENNSMEKTIQELYAAPNLFKNIYQKHLQGDLLRYTRRGQALHTRRVQRGQALHNLTISEVQSTRLVTSSSYEELHKRILNDCIRPLISGMEHSHKQTLDDRKHFIEINKAALQNGGTGSSDSGMLNIVVEHGHAPRLNSTQTSINFCLPTSYNIPLTDLNIVIIKDGETVATAKLNNVLDPDLLVQLDYQRYFKQICERLINRIHSQEVQLCNQMDSYYNKLKAQRLSLKQPKTTKEQRVNLQRSINTLIRQEPRRRVTARSRARQQIQGLRYDHRTWSSQPNKVYMTSVPGLPVGKALIQIKNKHSIIKSVPVDIKSGSMTIKIIGDL